MRFLSFVSRANSASFPSGAAALATAWSWSGRSLFRSHAPGWCSLLLGCFLWHAAPGLALEPNVPQPKHGLHVTQPIGVWDEALPLGNGILGALVWGDGQPLKISLDRTDLWDLTPVPEFHSPEYSFDQMRRWHQEGRHADLVRLYEQPYHRPAPTKIPAGRIEITLPETDAFAEASLTLADAMALVRFANGTQARLFLHAEKPVGMIEIRSRSAAAIIPKLLAPPFGGPVVHAAQGGIGAGDLAQLGYPPPEKTAGEQWQAFEQEGALGFRFAVYLAWRETEGGWLGAWSVASNREGPAPLELARRRVQEALRSGFASLATTHRAWWRQYWSQSSIRVPNPILERQWFLEQYKFGAASRRGAPPITLQGPWTADNGGLPPWKGDYHHDLNTQLCYWPCYSGNHLEEGLSFLDWLWDTRSNCVAWTKRFFNMPGMNVPMTADLDNNQIGGWRQYTHSSTTAAWLAQHFYLHWKYSADREFLRDRAWPYLREASVFAEAITAEKGPDGKRTLPLSASPEIHDNRPEAWFKEITNYDLALLRWLLGATAELADALQESKEAAHWRGVLAELPEFSLGDDGRLLIAKGQPLPASHRHFSHLMAVHPLGLIDPADGPDAQRIIDASLRDLDRSGTDWWCGYSFSWLGSLAARARDGAKAERALEIFSTAFTLPNSFHCNGDQSGKGYSKFRYRPFTLEGNFAAAAGLQEMLLQSHRGRIEVFPAVPPSWSNIAFTTLRAQGAFLVSAERRDGATSRVVIQSEKGGDCRLLSPFSGKERVLTLRPGQSVVLTNDPPRLGLGHPGHIFLAGEEVVVPLPDAETTWRLENYEGEVLMPVVARQQQTSLGVLPVGFYRLRKGPDSPWISLGVLAPLQAPIPPDSPVAVDVAMAWFYPPEKMDAVARLCTLAGIGWVRDRLNWAEMEPRKGEFASSTRYDASALAQAKAGLRVLQVIHASPGWANANRKRFPTDLRDAHQFYKEMARRWKGRVQAFEPWNEADIPMFGGHTGSEMASLQKAAYLGLKAGNPDILVCQNVFAHHKPAFLVDLQDNAAWPYFDTFNLHHYEPFDNYPKLYADFRAVSAGKPLWVTECSVPVKWAGDEQLKEPSEADLRIQAERVAKTFACSIQEGAHATFYFLLPHYVEGQTQFGILRPDLTPRPAYVALAAVGRLLAGARPLGRVRPNDESVRAFLFRAQPDGQDREVLVGWTTRATATLSLPLAAEQAFDHLGRPIAPALEMPLTSAPVFLLFPPGSSSRMNPASPPSPPPGLPGHPSPIVLQSAWPEEQLDLNQSAYRVDPGETVQLPVFVYHFGSQPAEGRFTVDTPAGWKADFPDRLQISPAERRELILRLTSSGAVGPDPVKICVRGDFDAAGQAVLCLRLRQEPSALP